MKKGSLVEVRTGRVQSPVTAMGKTGSGKLFIELEYGNEKKNEIFKISSSTPSLLD